MFELNSIKSTLSAHAFKSSILLQIKRESLQRQLEFLMQTNIFNNGIIVPYLNNHNLVYSQLLNLVIFIVAWYGYEKYNGPSSKFFKFNKFKYYKEVQYKIKICILIIAFIFFRNVETAI